MLNKDEYNQEEYEAYYRQETERIKVFNEDQESSSLISKLIKLLILLALIIAGYFGYKAINSKTATESIDTSLQVSLESSLPQSVQEKSSEEQEIVVETKEPIIKAKEPIKVLKDEAVNEAESAITSEVTKVVSTQKKMSPAEIASVVAAVMKQMNQDTNSDKSTDSVEVKENALLIDELSDSEVDSISADLIKELESVKISENTKIDSSEKELDVYNKVNVEDNSGSDTLSQLSQQITSLINEEENNNNNNNNNNHPQAVTYTESLKSEVVVRTNEMRIIVVKRGDTLGKIAERAYGNVMAYKKIYEANPELTRPDHIYVGQKLRIPN